MHQAPDPQPTTLLPPILSCLPTAFLSPRPPPALLPLLAPILRQRVSLLADPNTLPTQRQQSSNSRKQNWLSLLTWSTERAEKLVELVGDLQLEAHPVSGELELFGTEEDAGKIVYRRLDEETLQAKCDVPLYNLSVLWLWCEADTGGTGIEGMSALLAGGAAAAQDAQEQPAENGWKVAEVRPLDLEDDPAIKKEVWFASIGEAERLFSEQGALPTPQAGSSRAASVKSDDDDYWGRYDQSPGPSRSASTAPTANPASGPAGASKGPGPATELDYYSKHDSSSIPRRPKQSPAPRASQPTPPYSKNSRTNSTTGSDTGAEASYWSRYDSTPGPSRRPSNQQAPTLRSTARSGASATSEADYFARYADVQPALDGHDPDEEAGVESSLRPGARSWGSYSAARQASVASNVPAAVREESDDEAEQRHAIERRLDQMTAAAAGDNPPPRVYSPSPERPGSAAGSVEALEEAAAATTSVEQGVKQHISHEIKSLFMLAQKVGIERVEFERVVRRELEVLGLIEL